MKKLITCVLVWIAILGCSSTKKSIEANHPIHSLVSSKSFEFNADWANPMVTQSLTAVANAGLIPPGSNVSRINLAGNPNYIKVEGDSVFASLPYYGERQFGGGYGASTGIEFKGIPKDYEQTFDADRGTYTVNFKIQDNNDHYDVTMAIFPSKATTIAVNQNKRNAIRYDGAIKALTNNPKK